MLTLRWFRERGSPVSVVTLVTYLSGLLATGTAWAAPARAEGLDRDELSGALGSPDFEAGPRALKDRAASLGDPAGATDSPAESSESPSAPEAATPPSPDTVQSEAVPTVPEDSAELVSAQAISLPSGAATMAGMGESFTAQLTTGVAAYSVPFALPGGRAGFSPALSLIYSSSAGYGLAGVGWSLSGSLVVARQSDRGLPGYDDRDDWHPEQDRFSFGGQELVPICQVDGGECSGALETEEMPPWSDDWQYFRPRIEGSFLRFFWSPDHRTWRVQSKSGVNFELGVPLDGSDYTGALERNPSRPDEIYRWQLVRQYDSHGDPDAVPPAPSNLIVFRYFQDGNLGYLSDVYYTPPASEPGTADLSRYAHHVAFDYEARPDRSVSYRSGWLLEQRIRLTRVDVTSKPFTDVASSPRELVRRFHLEYEPGTHASLLKSFSLEGRCEEPVAEQSNGRLTLTTCQRLPPLSFEYQRVQGSALLHDEQGLEFARFSTTVREVEASPPHTLGSSASLAALIDVNSDSLPDVVVTNPVAFNGSHGVYFNKGESGGKLSFEAGVSMSVSGVPGVDAGILKLSNPNIAALDLDGNATTDLVHMPKVKRYAVFSPQKDGNTWRWQGRRIDTASGQDAKINFAQDARRTAVMDVNGDGLVDVVFASATEYQTFFALGRYPGGDGQFGHARWTGAETADLSDEPATACTPWSGTGVRLGDPDVRAGDLNGDGLPDLVRLRSGQILYWPGRGNGYFGTGERDDCKAGGMAQDRHIEMSNAPPFGTVQPGSLQLADVNGDGLGDVVEIRAEAVDVYLNENGLGFTDRVTLSEVPVQANTQAPVRLTDINGSGSADLLWGQGYEYRYIDLTGGVRPYLLSKVSNGLGKTNEFEYKSSAELMVEAAQAGQPWTRTMPFSTPVVVRSVTRDHLERIGRPAGRYVTEYRYSDPVFDGRQREFRGFRSAETRQLGDASSPTSIVRATHLLGECEAAQNGFDVCSPAERWRDNWREPLKGQPVLTEALDEQGVYLSTEHRRYELRQLYAGRDGRRVSIALTVGQQAFRYDTATFDTASTSVSLPEVDVNLEGIEQSETRSVTRRATAGTVRVESTSEHDDFGNVTSSTSLGCVQGCSSTDEAITQHLTTERVPDDTSGWLFRTTERFVTGSVHSSPRHQTRDEYDSRGDLERSFATLSGTLPLDRFHESSAPVAPSPPNASGGVSAPVEIELRSYERDAFGNLSEMRGVPGLGRCRSVVFDPDYASLPVEENVFGGSIAPSGCGELEFKTEATYDRGLALVLTTTDITDQPSRFDYDGFGRLLAATHSDPAAPGQLADFPTATYEYHVPDEWTETPYAVLVARVQDGATPNESEYHETYHYADGLGRKLVVLSEADPGAGDEGDFVVGSIIDYTAAGAPLRAFQSHFWTGDPFEYAFAEVPPLRHASQRYDAFARPIQTYGLDGQLKLATSYHALGMDRWDGADLEPGPHADSFASTRGDGHGRQVEAIERVRVNGVLEERRLLSEFLPTGEIYRVTQRRSGSADVVRWLRYDSLGRLVLNVEPNTSVGFDPDPATDPAGIKAWRFAYNDAGELVGTSDARGCGVNYHRDAAGRLIAEDYSPCRAGHAAYTEPNFTADTGIEVRYRYDAPDPDGAGIEDDAGRTLAIDASLLVGRPASVSDRGQKTVFSYDGRGRTKGIARRMVKPGAPSSVLADRYAPRWYIQETVLDAASRALETSTGATSAELLGTDGRSVIEGEYTQRGLVKRTTSSYGTLLDSHTVDANGLSRTVTLGDGAATQRTYQYDDNNRLASVQTYRSAAELWSDPELGTPATNEPTQQLLLEDYDVDYDAANNIVEIRDWRVPGEWPESAKPVTRKFQYDDLYRVTRATYEYAGGADAWTSAFAAENASSPAVADEPQPSPHVDFDSRVLEQRYQYDHLGNSKRTTDDSSGFFDRSLGDVTNGTALAGPHRLQSASNRTIASSSPRKGDLDVDYDASGNLTDLIVRRDGPCLPEGASCWQRFSYEWDELGQLQRARRWDLSATGPNERGTYGELSDPPLSRAPDVELRYAYSTSGNRVLKTAVDPASNERHTVYIFGSLELRRSEFESGDYSLTPTTENVFLGGSVSARVVYSEEDLPSLMSGGRHLFLLLGDHLGSNSFVIDHETGELVEHATYLAYGAADSNYRPGRWGHSREPYKFSGKEEDIEVGLVYFGARYLSLGLGRWMSPDPAAIHGLENLNTYSYVEGRPLVAVDPRGREPITIAAILIGIAIGAAIGAATAGVVYTATNYDTWNWEDFGKSVAIGAVTGAVGGAVAGIATGLMGGGIAVAAGSEAFIGGAGLSGASGALVAGGVAGAASSTASYLTAAGLTGQKVTWQGLALSFGTGLASGALMGWAAHKLFNSTAAAPKGERVETTTQTFKTREAAADWLASRYHDRAVINDQEFSVSFIQTKSGEYRISEMVVGEAGAVNSSAPKLLPGEKWAGTWHPHTKAPEFSPSYWDDQAGGLVGDGQVLSDATNINPDFKMYVSSSEGIHSVGLSDVPIPQDGTMGTYVGRISFVPTPVSYASALSAGASGYLWNEQMSGRDEESR